MLKESFNDQAGNRHELVEIARDNTALLEQLTGNDAVHDLGTGSVEELLRYRIGGPGMVKTAFALTDPAGELESVIYGYKIADPIRSPANLPGNVDAILHTEAQRPFHDEPTAIAFYSITSSRAKGPKDPKNRAKNTGTTLIQALLQHTSNQIVRATLSPLRTLAEAWPTFNAHGLQTKLAYAHLLEIKNPVQIFHMGNGAIIGDLKPNANRPDSKDGIDGRGFMVNYVYPADPAVRASNARLFKTLLQSNKKTPEGLWDMENIHIFLDQLTDPHLANTIKSSILENPEFLNSLAMFKRSEQDRKQGESPIEIRYPGTPYAIQ